MFLKSKLKGLPVAILLVIGAAAQCPAQHLWWKVPTGVRDVTCVYGQIKVLATQRYIYYCGCNWNPGEPAGGYTGIQDKGQGIHNMIFSIWDTSPTLHPTVSYASSIVNHGRFGGEGTGSHTDAVIGWKLNSTYEFCAEKKYYPEDNSTLTSVFFKDPQTGKWQKEATITSPNGKFKSVSRFGPTMAAFLENWVGKGRKAPKVALYRLWVGSSPSKLTMVTKAGGDGRWGTVGDWFYLAEGDTDKVDAILRSCKAADKGKFTVGGTGTMSIANKSLHRPLPKG